MQPDGTEQNEAKGPEQRRLFAEQLAVGVDGLGSLIDLEVAQHVDQHEARRGSLR